MPMIQADLPMGPDGLPQIKPEYNGTYVYATGDMFSGTLNVKGKPAGRGILYYFESGECDVAVFDESLNQTGEGVRYSKERDTAYTLMDGELVGGAINLEQALKIMSLQETPAMRTKDTIPTPAGMDPARHKQTMAWYHYRQMAGLPMNESPCGPSPYPPQWRQGSVEAEAE
eukprot:gnl/TRDRNA2_/TRDRNA2_180615_c0_seq1.p1 gnl/TRDRNA2_/TRDRNA2_180615_c0~~gnl/TRDRNA2_/TRDRNA2_180615_c0_seq1.p1  ORF type:complete len:172 (-),score=37.65 gnl/TRDRNA2_/TRDRNA2_180615_c0_seq1:66-581(-)